MMRSFTTLLLVVAIGASSLAQSTAPAGGRAQQANIEQTLRGLSDQWSKVYVTRDASVLRRIWATEFVYVEPSGRVFNKEEALQIFPRSLTKSHRPSSAISRSVCMAQARLLSPLGTIVKSADKDGKAFDRKSRFTNVWVLQNGAWQCVSGHSSDMPSK
jgi:hypothetical protein